MSAITMIENPDIYMYSSYLEFLDGRESPSFDVLDFGEACEDEVREAKYEKCSWALRPYWLQEA